MVHRVHMHFSGTSCLCMCHYDSHAECDVRECRLTARADAARSFVAPTITFDGGGAAGTYCRMDNHAIPLPAPVQAIAAEPFVGVMTPMGMTTRFGR